MGDTTDLALATLTAALVLYTWRLAGQNGDLANRLTQATSDACRARARVLEFQARNRRLRHTLSVTGFTPPRHGNPWPEPAPLHGPPEPVPDAPAWCYEPIDADPEGELVGGIFHLDERCANTSETPLPWLVTT